MGLRNNDQMTLEGLTVLLKSLGSQIGNIDLVNEQTRRMAEQIEELNHVYDRMLQSMTVNMKPVQNKEA